MSQPFSFYKPILEWMWAHGKFLTDVQAQAIINKIDQKDDGKVKHKGLIAICIDKTNNYKNNYKKSSGMRLPDGRRLYTSPCGIRAR